MKFNCSLSVAGGMFIGAVGCFIMTATARAHDGDIGILLDAQPAYQGTCWTRNSDGDGGSGAPPTDIAFASSGVELLTWIPVTVFDPTNTSSSTVEGYVSPSGREYAIIGLSGGTGFVNVTDPGNAQIVAFISSSPAPASLWRDVRVYQNYCYAVSEGGGGIQVINMNQIDSGIVTVVGNVNTPGSASTHTVFLNQDSGYIYRCGGGSTLGVRIYSLTNPASPTYVTTALAARYSHECQAVNYTSGPYAGKEILFCYSDSNSGGGSPAVDILDVTNKANIIPLSTATYINGKFSHQGWLSPDKHYIYVNDELDNQNATGPYLTRIIDVSNLSAPVYIGTVDNGVGAIDHNLYTQTRNGINLIFESNYRSGLRVWDASNATAPTEIAFFDTYPPDDLPNFNGLWDNYPYLPSGIILGSDIEKGLFVWRLGQASLVFSYPNGRPDFINPNGQSLQVSIANQSGTLLAGSAKLNFSVNGGAFSAVNLVRSGGNLFQAVFPALPCGAQVRYYISAQTSGGITLRDPQGAPALTYTATAAIGVGQVGFFDDMESDTGWVVGVPGDSAVTGIWVRVDPNGTSAQPEDDHTPAPGIMCYVTGQGTPGGSVGENDVDGPANGDGVTTLTSPVMNAAGLGEPYIEYFRWYSNDQGSNPGTDSMPVQISNNNGSTWTQLELVTENANAWVGKSFRISDFVTPTNQVKLRFIARDLLPASVVEAAVDDVRIVFFNCAAPVPGDVTGDGHVNVDDLLGVINAWGRCPAPPAPCPADIAPPPSGNGVVNVDDLLMVINNWG